MVRLYVEAISTPDAIPNVQRAWDTFVSAKCADVKQTALQTYDALMTSQLCDVLPCSNTEIRSSHGASLEACEAQFMIELAGISTNTVEMASRELKVRQSTMHDKSPRIYKNRTFKLTYNVHRNARLNELRTSLLGLFSLLTQQL